jgi:hypothetical protein
VKFGTTDGPKADAPHEVSVVARDEEESEWRAQLVDHEVLVVPFAAVALLELVTRRMHHGERAARVNGFGHDGDGEHVDIVRVGSDIVPG